jgi:hypothetical protein
VARLLDKVEAQLAPANGLIILLGTGFRGTFLPDFHQRRLSYPGPDIVYLMSANGSAHEDHVTLEAWDGPPPPDDDADLSETTELHLSEGQLYVSRQMRSAASPILSAGPAGRFRMRANVFGRTALAARYAANSDQDGPGLTERVRVRLWPLAD